jgi:hypothetical protein
MGFITCIALYVRYALAYPACAIENLPAHDAIKRSISLGEGNRWKIFCGLLLPVVLGVGMNLSVVGLIRHLKSSIPLIADNRLAIAGLEGTGILLVSLIFFPLIAIVLTLLYYDQRIRREGYDVERMMESAGMNSVPALPVEGGVITPDAEEEVQA